MAGKLDQLGRFTALAWWVFDLRVSDRPFIPACRSSTLIPQLFLVLSNVHICPDRTAFNRYMI